jgi:hypothetical protein
VTLDDRYYCPRWLHLLIMFVFVVAFQASNISAIILSSQTMDTTLGMSRMLIQSHVLSTSPQTIPSSTVALFKKSVALEIYPTFGGTSTADGVRLSPPQISLKSAPAALRPALVSLHF